MKHLINTKTNTCTNCGESLGNIKGADCNPARMKRATTGCIDDAKDFLDTLEALAKAHGFTAEEPIIELDDEEKALLKMIHANPMPTNHIGVLQLPLKHIEMMVEFKREGLIYKQGNGEQSYWYITQTGLDLIKDEEPEPVLLSLGEVALLLSISSGDVWSAKEIHEHDVRLEMHKLRLLGLVRNFGSDCVITPAGKAHVDKILALVV